MYKVGDTITLIADYPAGCTSGSFRSGLRREILDKYGGKQYKIVNVGKSTGILKEYTLPDDGMRYTLADSRGDLILNSACSSGIPYYFNSSAFVSQPAITIF